jgi:cytidine deaminase
VADFADLLALARGVAQHAYAPYSHFRVGAAVRAANGATYVGCNVESASYGLTVCAERNAIFAAVAAGAPRPLTAMALSCLDAETGGCMPCGACRQVIVEHLAPEARVVVDGGGDYRAVDLLPFAFKLDVE